MWGHRGFFGDVMQDDTPVEAACEAFGGSVLARALGEAGARRFLETYLLWAIRVFLETLLFWAIAVFLETLLGLSIAVFVET